MAANITSFPSAVRSRLADGPFYYGWFVVGVCFLSALITWGTVWSFSVFFRHIVTTFGLSYANTSIIFSIQSIVTYGGAAVLGLVIDRYGARRLLLIATGLIIAGLAGTSFLPTFTGVLIAYSVVAAAGFSIVFVIAYATPARWFDRRRGLATGIAAAGASAGTLLIPPSTEVLIAHVGWRAAYGSLTMTFLAILIVTILVIADRPASLDIDTSTESPTGYLDEAHHTADWNDQIKEILAVARSPPFLFLFIAYLSFASPTAMVMVHIVEFTTTRGIRPSARRGGRQCNRIDEYDKQSRRRRYLRPRRPRPYDNRKWSPPGKRDRGVVTGA